MRIGIDFDNTIACSDPIFKEIAQKSGLGPIGKEELRERLVKIKREDDYTMVQGIVYGPRLKDAKPFPGLKDFLERCRECSIGVDVISHKTQFPAKGQKWDLHATAHAWLETHGLAPFIEQVFFEPTRDDKVARIIGSGISSFIDDLVEVLTHQAWATRVERMLFDPGHKHDGDIRFRRVHHWNDVERAMFGSVRKAA